MLPRSEFNRNRSKHDGLSDTCRECDSARVRRYRATGTSAREVACDIAAITPISRWHLTPEMASDLRVTRIVLALNISEEVT